MSGVPDHDRIAARPFLIERQEDGSFRLVSRQTRYNSQNYPVTTSKQVGEGFKTAAAARAFAKAEFGAEAGEFAMK